MAAIALSTSPRGTVSTKTVARKTPTISLTSNVRGTFEVFEAAVSLGIDKIVFISTTSVYRPDSRYGSSKILAELIAEDYRKHRDINVITLRPRGFIPYWNREVYASYSDWARWFWKGAVHIDDVAAAVILSLDLISRQRLTQQPTIREYHDRHTRFKARRGPRRPARVESGSEGFEPRAAEFRLLVRATRAHSRIAQTGSMQPKQPRQRSATRTMPSCRGMSTQSRARAVPSPTCR